MAARCGAKFPRRLWHWTGAHESLFDLDDEALYVFGLLVAAAFATDSKAR